MTHIAATTTTTDNNDNYKFIITIITVIIIITNMARVHGINIINISINFLINLFFNEDLEILRVEHLQVIW